MKSELDEIMMMYQEQPQRLQSGNRSPEATATTMYQAPTTGTSPASVASGLRVQIPTAQLCHLQPLAGNFNSGHQGSLQPGNPGQEAYVKCDVPSSFGSSPTDTTGGLISPMSSPGNIPLSLQQPQHTGGWQPSPTIPQTHYPQVSNPGPSGSSHTIQTQPHPTSILRNALTKPKPHHQATIRSSCPTPNVTIGREVQSSIAGVKSEPISTGRSAGTEEMEAVEEMENQVLLSNTNPPTGQAVAAQTTHKIKPKYNFEAIKNYPPFRDAYNAAMASRRRSKSFGQGARQRSSSESLPPSSFMASLSDTRHRAPSGQGGHAHNSIKCSRCNQVLTSKCLVQRCYEISEQTKCKNCGKELTTKCLLANCTK